MLFIVSKAIILQFISRIGSSKQLLHVCMELYHIVTFFLIFLFQKLYHLYFDMLSEMTYVSVQGGGRDDETREVMTEMEEVCAVYE